MEMSHKELAERIVRLARDERETLPEIERLIQHHVAHCVAKETAHRIVWERNTVSVQS